MDTYGLFPLERSARGPELMGDLAKGWLAEQGENLNPLERYIGDIGIAVAGLIPESVDAEQFYLIRGALLRVVNQREAGEPAGDLNDRAVEAMLTEMVLGATDNWAGQAFGLQFYNQLTRLRDREGKAQPLRLLTRFVTRTAGIGARAADIAPQSDGEP